MAKGLGKRLQDFDLKEGQEFKCVSDAGFFEEGVTYKVCNVAPYGLGLRGKGGGFSSSGYDEFVRV